TAAGRKAPRFERTDNFIFESALIERGGGTGPMKPGNLSEGIPMWCQFLQRVYLWEMRVWTFAQPFIRQRWKVIFLQRMMADGEAPLGSTHGGENPDPGRRDGHDAPAGGTFRRRFRRGGAGGMQRGAQFDPAGPDPKDSRGLPGGRGGSDRNQHLRGDADCAGGVRTRGAG